MAFQKIANIKITGIAACVPDNVVDNSKLKLLGDSNDVAKFIETTGIAKRHTVGDTKICASDLCFEAAEKLIADLNWNKDEIDLQLLVFCKIV
jgi:3-oxoacyl-[acyl-carrier-protein] synthase-3